jgi:hypothetical protein
MSRMEYNEEVNNQSAYDDDNNRSHGFAQSYCAYCYEPHVKDQVGLLSARSKAWFCSGACQSMYSHDNKLVQFAPETVAVLEGMRKKFYSSDKINQRRRKANIHH